MNRLAVIEQLLAWGVECFTRKEWGSPREADGSYARRRTTHSMPEGPAAYHYLHITVTRDTDIVREGKAAARQVETFGYSSPPMVSYQDLVTNEGRYFQGQDYGTKGTHTVNDKAVPGFPRDLNLVGYACALMQNVGDEVTDVQVDVVARVFAARELAGLVKAGAPIYPHRKFAAKACPGDKAVARLDEIRRLKDHYVQTAHEEDDMAYTDKDRERDDKLVADQKARAVRSLAFQKTVLRALVADDQDREQIKGDLTRLLAELDVEA